MCRLGGFGQIGRRRHLYGGEVFVPGSQRLPRGSLFGADNVRLERADAGKLTLYDGLNDGLIVLSGCPREVVTLELFSP